MRMRIIRRVEETPRVVSLFLEPCQGRLPSAEPGSHVDILTPVGLRQYSLSLIDEHQWRVSVSRDESTLGGSIHLCDSIAAGDTVEVGLPRNNLELEDASSYLFLAGGIGITPFIPLISHARTAGRNWRLAYAARDRASFAFRQEIVALGGETTFWPRNERPGRFDISDALAELRADELVYVCGPEAMLQEANSVAGSLGISDRIRFERFEPVVAQDEQEPVDFTLICEQSGIEVPVGREACILDVLSEHGIFVPTSCASGFCGTCETPVLEGTVVHRDSLLSDTERAANDRMYVCVSRCSSGRLVLDV